MKNILVPFDSSKPAVNAFRFALDVAERSKGTVHLLHVIELPVMHDTVLMPVLNFEQQLFKELREKAEHQFRKVVEKYNEANVNVVSEVQFGKIAAKIIEYAQQHETDVIMMGSHGASGLREALVGSNAEKIVRQASIPVLVSKDFFKGTVSDIVFPHTLELENQETLVRHVKLLQHFFQARLHLLWINTPANFTSDEITFVRLDKFARRFMLKDYTLNVFNSRDEEAGILAFTHKVNAQVIAMGTHGRTGLSHLLNGSIAEDIVNHSDKLIWTYSVKHEAIEA